MSLRRLNPKALFALVLILFFCAASAEQPIERWHVMSIDDTAVGSIHEVFERDGEQLITTESSVMVLNRLGARIEAGITAKSFENANGELHRVELAIDQSDQIMEVLAFQEGDQWVTRSATPGIPEQQISLEQPLRGPRAVAELLVGLNEPGDSVNYHAFVSATMQPGEIHAELVGFEQVRNVSLRVIEEHLPGFPAPLTRLIDEQGRNVITRLPSPFGLTETTLADEVAAKLAEGGGELPEEVFEATILKTGVRLPQPRNLEYLELELTHRNPALGWPNLNSEHQRVLSQDEDRVVVAIERRHPRQSVPFSAEVSSALDAYLSANAMLQTTQPELVDMARSITQGHTDRWQAAQALRRWVSENMSFDAGVVLASSSEVLANRRGTCTEFAVLLTALSRAAGIPARYVQGYVYAHGMLAGHAWTEVMIGEDWLALDAAIPSEGSADAARLAFVWSDFNNGPGELNAGASMQMFGQIDARVLGWRTADGIEQRFPDGAPSPQVTDGRFVDGIQGIEWTVPEAWTVVDYQQTWPSNLVAAAEDSAGERFELRWISQHPWERAGIDWIEPNVDEAGDVETSPFGRPDSWLIVQDDRVRFVQAGVNGHWQLIGNDADQLRALASGLQLPSS
ncbi:MAG: transglutaminase-like domain-containing protein [Pseudomonadota bacterium]